MIPYDSISHRIHVWYIYILTWLGYIDGIHVTIYSIHGSYWIWFHMCMIDCFTGGMQQSNSVDALWVANAVCSVSTLSRRCVLGDFSIGSVDLLKVTFDDLKGSFTGNPWFFELLVSWNVGLSEVNSLNQWLPSRNWTVCENHHGNDR